MSLGDAGPDSLMLLLVKNCVINFNFFVTGALWVWRTKDANRCASLVLPEPVFSE